MREKVWVQCAKCGHLSQVKRKNASISDDDLYTGPIYCSSCRDGTKHLLIGEHKDMRYIYGDNTLDERFFIY